MIMGGCDTVSYKDTAAVLDIASKQLIFAGKMTEQRVYCGCAVLKDVVYVVGGYVKTLDPLVLRFLDLFTFLKVYIF